MVLDLIHLGITPKKSLVADFPEVPKTYLSHFLRGIIDGDGWIDCEGYSMNVTSASKKFSYALLDIFHSLKLNTYIYKQKTPQNTCIYRVNVTGKEDILKLANWLYQDAGDLFLERKYNNFYYHMNKNKVGNDVSRRTKRQKFRTNISKTILEEFAVLAKKNKTYTNHLIESGLRNILSKKVVLKKQTKPKDRVQYKTTYDKQLLDQIRKYAAEYSLNINDVIEQSINFINFDDLEKKRIIDTNSE